MPREIGACKKFFASQRITWGVGKIRAMRAGIELTHFGVDDAVDALNERQSGAMAGEKGWTRTGVGADDNPSCDTMTFTVAVAPAATISHGTCALICDCDDALSGWTGATRWPRGRTVAG